MPRQTRIEDKVDKLADKLDVMNATMIKQEFNLREHMKRTSIAEQRIEKLSADVFPLKIVAAVFKITVSMGIVLGILASIYQILEYYK